MAVAWLGFVKPLVVQNTVSVDGPDPLGSAAYAADFDEVKRSGSASSTERTDAQTETALFFSVNPVSQLREALLRRLDSQPLSLAQTTRLFATLDAATADALIQGWRLKYELGFWRPFQPSRLRPRMAMTPRRRTLLDTTPPVDSALPGLRERPRVRRRSLHRDRGTGHRRPRGAEAALTQYQPGRTNRTLRDLEHDAFMARIWLGIHFRDAMEDGYRLGHVVGTQVRSELG